MAQDLREMAPTATIRIGVLKEGGGYDVVSLPIETYVARVLTGEALPGSPASAYEALAIAIRTYTVGNRGKHQSEGFDLCDQTHCQVMRTSTPVTERAALATAGQVMLYNGAPANVYYSASCGGRSEKPSNVWPGAEDVSYLPIQSDQDGCGGSPAWSTELSVSDLERALRGAGFRGALRDARIGERNESGRAANLVLDGMTPARISGQDLRAAVGRTIGWQYVRSTNFDLERTRSGFRFTGHGYGHGVGMCVIGSTKLAAAGESARQILGRYFPGTEISTLAPRLTSASPQPPKIAAAPAPTIAAPPAPVVTPSEIAIALPEGDEGERRVIATIVARERTALTETLGIPVAPKAVLRFHPTTDAFEKATGEAWFTIGAVANGELHFVPLAILRDNGILERAIRQQLVHLMADAAFANRPRWVREGAALHFADNSNGPGNRGTCPTDAEFIRPVSIGALSDVNARARACFERSLSAGRNWRDVR